MRTQVLIAGVAATALAAGLGFVVVSSLTDTDADPDTRTDTHTDASPDASTDPSPDDSTDSPPPTETAQLRMLPPIAQPGPAAAPASQADVALAAQMTPAGAGREVTLERLDDGAWEPVATEPENAQGLVQFSAPAKVDGAVATYRVTAGDEGADGDGVVSPRVRADSWAEPDFSDEFSGTELSADWQPRGQVYNHPAGRGCSIGSLDAVEVEGGTARLSVLKDPDRAGTKCAAKAADGSPLGEYDWRLNGHISTQDSASFTYGVAAARIKFQPLRGQHGAFWMQPQEVEQVFNDPGRSGAEIDVIEWFGNDQPSGGLASYAYYDGVGGELVKVGTWLNHPERFLSGAADSWSSQFHVFSVEWTPDDYTFRIDGRVSFRTKRGVSGQPEYLILSLLSSDYEMPFVEGDQLPQTMEVDWVRYWKQP